MSVSNTSSGSRSRKHKTPSEKSGFMTLGQVCEEYGISQSFLYHLPDSALPRYPVGKKIFYQRAEVVDAILSKRLGQFGQKKTVRGRGRPAKPVVQEAVAKATATPVAR